MLYNKLSLVLETRLYIYLNAFDKDFRKNSIKGFQIYFLMRSILITLIAVVFSAHSLNAQAGKSHSTHAFSRAWVVSLEGGFTLAYTDYLRTKPAGTVRGSIEYYFPSFGKHIIGFKLFVGGQKLSGEDDRPSMDTEFGEKPLMPVFVTDMYLAGLGIIYSYSINDKIFPFIQLGESHLWFSPKDESGKVTLDNRSGVYKKTTFTFDLDLGFKFLVSDIVSLNISGGAHFPSSDYLDDIAGGNSTDLYFTGLVGVSVSPFVRSDSDNDGILDKYDACPDSPEDYDGFEDEDGCPDYDNDNDGIPDVQDQCPNEAEDFDGYMDNDGCPDVDNDGDGILDINDECPNQPEDKDGYLDQDGCPDLDNDNDGIPDEEDACPNQPETFNGFEDSDGCPDQLNVFSVSKISYQAEEIFYENSAKIKPEGVQKLDQALEVIKQDHSSVWRVEGHMDTHGTEQYIRKMSYDRAAAVRDYFISHGISSSRIDVYGMSDDFPVGDNTTKEGRRKNRRIEIVKEER